MSEQSRRDFLKKLGLGFGAISILPAWYRFGEVLPFQRALYNVPEIGKITPQWIVAETLTAISRRLHGHKFDLPEYEKQLFPDLRLHEGDNLYSLPIAPSQFPEFPIGRAINLTEFRERVIEKKAAQLADVCSHFGRSGQLEIPRSVDFAAMAKDENNGLWLRFVRAFSIDDGDFVNRFDVKVSR